MFACLSFCALTIIFIDWFGCSDGKKKVAPRIRRHALVGIPTKFAVVAACGSEPPQSQRSSCSWPIASSLRFFSAIVESSSNLMQVVANGRFRELREPSQLAEEPSVHQPT
jgi:hypothetical protein